MLIFDGAQNPKIKMSKSGQIYMKELQSAD